MSRGRPAEPVTDPDARWVRETRRAAGLTQAQLAAALSVDVGTVSRLERGTISLSTVLRLAIERVASA